MDIDIADLVDDILGDSDAISASALAADLTDALGAIVRAQEVAELADDLGVPRLRGGAFAIDAEAAEQIVAAILGEDEEDDDPDGDDEEDDEDEDDLDDEEEDEDDLDDEDG